MNGYLEHVSPEGQSLILLTAAVMEHWQNYGVPVRIFSAHPKVFKWIMTPEHMKLYAPLLIEPGFLATQFTCFSVSDLPPLTIVVGRQPSP